MTPAEREQSEARRKLIAAQNRAANPRRPNRFLPQNSLAEDLAALLGKSVTRDTADVDWRALTKDA